MSDIVEKTEAVEVRAEVVEAVHRMNCHLTFACSSCTVSSSSAPWTVYAALLLLIPFVALIQLHVPLVGLLELPLHRLIQRVKLIMDGLQIDPSTASS